MNVIYFKLGRLFCCKMFHSHIRCSSSPLDSNAISLIPPSPPPPTAPAAEATLPAPVLLLWRGWGSRAAWSKCIWSIEVYLLYLLRQSVFAVFALSKYCGGVETGQLHPSVGGESLKANDLCCCCCCCYSPICFILWVYLLHLVFIEVYLLHQCVFPMGGLYKYK